MLDELSIYMFSTDICIQTVARNIYDRIHAIGCYDLAFSFSEDLAHYVKCMGASKAKIIYHMDKLIDRAVDLPVLSNRHLDKLAKVLLPIITLNGLSKSSKRDRIRKTPKYILEKLLVNHLATFCNNLASVKLKAPEFETWKKMLFLRRGIGELGFRRKSAMSMLGLGERVHNLDTKPITHQLEADFKDMFVDWTKQYESVQQTIMFGAGIEFERVLSQYWTGESFLEVFGTLAKSKDDDKHFKTRKDNINQSPESQNGGEKVKKQKKRKRSRKTKNIITLGTTT